MHESSIYHQLTMLPEAPFASQGRVSDSNPVGYKPPAPLYWNHSIYSYNKNTMPVIPATSATARRMIRLYYNMIPRGFEDVLGRQVNQAMIRI